MRNLPLVLFGLLFTVAASWCGLVLAPAAQYGAIQTARADPDEDDTPRNPPLVSGLAQQGRQVYLEMGCADCHTQQVRPNPGPGRLSADLARGWGQRVSVPRDYILQPRVLLGSLRVGPDLADFGERKIAGLASYLARAGDATAVASDSPYARWHRLQFGNSSSAGDLTENPSTMWLYCHLYDPQSTSPGSVMPPFRFLFETKEINGEPSPLALKGLPSDEQPPPGCQIIPTPRARVLVAYLQSLKLDYELPEAKFTVPPPGPAAPAKMTGNVTASGNLTAAANVTAKGNLTAVPAAK